MALAIESFFHQETNTISHLIWDEDSRDAAIIDPVLDFESASGATSTEFADLQIKVARDKNLNVIFCLETHINADHLTAAQYLKETFGLKVGIGSGVTEVQKTFGKIFNAEPEFLMDGSQFDLLFEDGEILLLGSIKISILQVPGHTPSCCCFVVEDNAFVGDTIFMPDVGTSRCDFPGGDARQLYASIQRILSLPDDTRLYICHDYGCSGREIAWQTTVGDEKRNNIHIRNGISEDDYLEIRKIQDTALCMPKLILPSVQVNMRAGEFPPVEDNGVAFLKLPLNCF